MLAEKAACSQKHIQLPELLHGNASPHTHTQHGGHRNDQPQASAALGHSHASSRHHHIACATQQEACQATTSSHKDLQPELTFNLEQAPAAAMHCLRCGVKAGQDGQDCRFHPALLQDPGPLLYSPEWHACRAAKHDAGTTGCFVRQGHYFPGPAVQATGLTETHTAGSRASSHTLHEHLQPRSRLPVPVHRR